MMRKKYEEAHGPRQGTMWNESESVTVWMDPYPFPPHAIQHVTLRLIA